MLRESGSGMRLNHKTIFALTDTETVKLDFDDTHIEFVYYWACRAMNWHKLGGFIILESSRGCYHVLFDRKVDWSKNMMVVAWVAQLSGNVGLQRWHRMQCIKGKSTLRVSCKGGKAPPKIVMRKGRQSNQIKEFLTLREELEDVTSPRYCLKNLINLNAWEGNHNLDKIL